MTSNPRSYRAAILAAFHCTHPDIDAADSALLGYLAASASGITNCHPGNRNIADALKLTDSPTDNRLAKNIKRGLIERIHRGDGRKTASIYRICWESPYFPDQTPGGKWLIEKPPCLDGANDPEPPCLDGADIGNRPAENGNRPAEPDKPPCVGPETALRKMETALSRQGNGVVPDVDLEKDREERPACCENEKNRAGSAGRARLSSSSLQPSQHQRWVNFIQEAGEDLPATMRCATPTEEERDAVLEQLSRAKPITYAGQTTSAVKLFAQAISEWEELQSPPLSGLYYHRWTRWLETGQVEFADWCK